MTDADASENTDAVTDDDGGVLAKLPRRRPQRASPRRAAARAASANGRATLAEAKPIVQAIEAERAPERKPAPDSPRTRKARTPSGANRTGTKRSEAATKPTARPVASG